jgi:hypothetical protein
MKIQPVNDKWEVTWLRPSIIQLSNAQEWLYDLWQNDWGTLQIKNLNSDGQRSVLFRFHRLDHANWFMLKWS